MYLKINVDNVVANASDLCDIIEKSYGLTGCYHWYKKDDGNIYTEFREHYEERIDLSDVQRKAYDIYKQLKELSDLEYKAKNKNKK